MIIIKNASAIEAMRNAGAITKGALKAGGAALAPGKTTAEIDRIIHDYIVSHGAKPSFLGYADFPASSCISVDDEVIHGIPGNRVLQEGSIVKLDVGAYIGGYHGDCAATFAVGEISPEAKQLIDVTRQSFYEALKVAREGYRLGDIGAAVSDYVERFGYTAVRDYVGHGIGRAMHEDPSVPNYGTPGRGLRLRAGMTIAIEPMINAGGAAIKVAPDGWTVSTQDGSLSSHYENTIVITDGEPEILTMA